MPTTKTYNPPESAQGLWYDPKINRFVDEGGYILHDLHQYFNLWQLDEWKKTRGYALLEDRNGDFWELFYPDNDLEELCEHDCDLCDSKCEIYGFLKEWQQDQNYIQIRKEIFQ